MHPPHNAMPATLMCLFVYVCLLTSSSSGQTEPKQQVLLVSMDGFRHDYFARARTPNFDTLRQSGVSMDYMNNTFATSTFPNHYTMVTGMYTESHGIIANAMYDPVLDKHFTTHNNETEWWDGGEPVWITAVKAGLTSGVYFWAGSNVKIQDLRPTHWLAYNRSTPFEERVNVSIGWLVDGIDLVCLYFHEPDLAGHTLGPEDAGMVPVIERMDGVLGDIVQSLQTHGLKDKVNLIVASDHGMTTIDQINRVIDISSHVNDSLLLEVVEQGAYGHLRPQKDQAQALFDALNGTAHMTVWKKADIPERFHMKHHRRVMDVFALAEEGWKIVANMNETNAKRGGHGYDNYLPNMKPFFMARGPAFKSGVKVDPITNRDIYPLICQLLDITAAPNNGSLTRATTLLLSARTDSRNNSATSSVMSVLSLGAALFSLIYLRL